MRNVLKFLLLIAPALIWLFIASIGFLVFQRDEGHAHGESCRFAYGSNLDNLGPLICDYQPVINLQYPFIGYLQYVFLLQPGIGLLVFVAFTPIGLYKFQHKAGLVWASIVLVGTILVIGWTIAQNELAY